MSGSFSIALSGLTADTAALDIVGNNLANLNTTGYKDTTASFYDLLSQSAGGGAIQIGGGVSANIEPKPVHSRVHSAYRRRFRRGYPRQWIFRGPGYRRGYIVYPRRQLPTGSANGNLSHRHWTRCARLDGRRTAW